jgi:hypothetical protein
MTTPTFSDGKNKGVRVDWVVENVVDSAPDYHDRDLAELRRKVETLTSLVASLAMQLTPEQQRAFVEDRCYGWVPE